MQQDAFRKIPEQAGLAWWIQVKTQKSIKVGKQIFHVGDRVQIRCPSGKFPPYKGTIRAIGEYGGLPAMNVDGIVLTWEMFWFMRKLSRKRYPATAVQ